MYLLTICSPLSIIWVSDLAETGTNTLDDPDGPYPDEGFLTLLRGAGHTVTRFNAPTGGLSTADLALLNGADLVVLGRAGSVNFNDAVERTAWNTLVTTPIMSTNLFSVRRDSLGWFQFNGAVDTQGFPTRFTFPSATSAVSAFLIGNTAINTATSTTVNDMFVDVGSLTVGGSRGTTVFNFDAPPVTGGQVVATITIAGNTDFQIATFAAGVLSHQAQPFAGFRMFFAAGNREGLSPALGGDGGFENLSPEAELMFLRAVQLTANDGLAAFCCATSVFADPHVRGANGIDFDFGGQPGANYTLLSAPGFDVTMQLAARGPSMRFMTRMALLVRGKSLVIEPWAFKNRRAEMVDFFAEIGATVLWGTWRVTVELCASHSLSFTVLHSKHGSLNYLNLDVVIPGCHDAYDGVLGQTYQCKWRSEAFAWSPSMEEAFRVPTLTTPSGTYGADGQCADVEEYRGVALRGSADHAPIS